MTNNELQHFGILGMKWGVKRNQTQSSRSVGSSKSKSDKFGKKKVESMSDDELRKVVNRLQMEKQYSQLASGNVSKGKQYISNVIKAGTTVAAVTTTGLTIYNNVDKIKGILGKINK